MIMKYTILKTIFRGIISVFFVVCTLQTQEQAATGITKLHVSFGIGWMHSSLHHSVRDAFIKAGLNETHTDWYNYGMYPGYPHAEVQSTYRVMSAEYSLVPRIRISLSMHEIPERSIVGGFDEFESINGMSLSAGGEYVILPYRKSSLRNLEIVFGTGLCADIIDVRIQRSQWWYDEPKDYRKTHFAGGVFLRSGIDYYFSSSISVRFFVEGRLMSDETIPSFLFVYEDVRWDEELDQLVYDTATKILGEHLINNSALLYQISVRVHL
jgi:hypothetical protein